MDGAVTSGASCQSSIPAKTKTNFVLVFSMVVSRKIGLSSVSMESQNSSLAINGRQ